MSAVGHPEGPVDFGGLDFDRLWKGREKTTDVERGIVLESIAGRDTRRILEVGPGGGRIASVLLAAGREYVGVDVTLPFLVRLRARWGGAGMWLAADLARLPLESGAFSGAVLIRVYNFLTEPAESLRELFRVLAPGGWLLISYFSERTVATAWEDLRRRIRIPESSETRPTVSPAYRPSLPSRARFRASIEAAGFLWEHEYSVGLEDFRPFRGMPAKMFVSLGRTFGPTGVLPHHFVLLRKPGAPPPELPPIDQTVVCPDCRFPLTGLGSRDDTNATCSGCGRQLTVVDGVPDLRPPDPSGGQPRKEPIRVRAP